MTDMELVDVALRAMERSYAPYSQFNVGAALLGKSGNVYSGCNVENASYGACNCAERTAVFKAVSEGEREFTAIAIVGGKDGRVNGFCAPCGICRQVLSEFAKSDFAVILYNGTKTEHHTLGSLLPMSFSSEDMK